MRLVLSLFMLFATVVAPATALPSSTGTVGDVSVVQRHNIGDDIQNTVLQVSESPQGAPTLFNVAPVTTTIAAAQAPAPAAQVPVPDTNPPTDAPAPADPHTAAADANAAANANAVKKAFNMVTVKLKAFLAGKGTLAQLQQAIKNLMKQIQGAVQKAKAAKKKANANNAVKMIVTTAAAPAGLQAQDATSSFYQIGFQDIDDANEFAEMTQQMMSSDSTIRAESALTSSGDLASQLQPAQLDANGNVVVAAATVALYTCPDGTQVSQDMVAILCPADATTADAPATAAAGSTMPLSNGGLIGIIIGGVLVLMVIGGIAYKQKSKSTRTVVSRV